MTTTKPNSDFDFSAAMGELESITNDLEAGEVGLDEALKKFERGSELARELQKYLKEAENKIEHLSKDFSKD